MKSGCRIVKLVAGALLAVGLVLVIVGSMMGASWRDANVSLGSTMWGDRWYSRWDRGSASSTVDNSVDNRTDRENQLNVDCGKGTVDIDFR